MEAGLIGLLRTTAIIIIIYYVFKLIFSKIFKTSKRGANSSINNDAKSNSSDKKDKLGDYVDYEDLSD